MSSGQDYTNRLLEDVRQTLAHQAAGLADDLRDLQTHLSSAFFPRLEEKLSALRTAEFPSFSAIVTESLDPLIRQIRQKDTEKALLVRFSREIRQKETQAEILALLLETANSVAPRVALLIVRGEQVVGWSSRGYSEEITADIKACSFPKSEDILQKALDGDGPTSFAEISSEHPLRKLAGNDFEGRLHIVPLKAIQRPVALVVAQDTSGHACDLESLGTMIEITGLCIENIALKIMQEMKSGAATPSRPSHASRPTVREEETTPPVPEEVSETERHPIASEARAPVVTSVEAAAEPESATVHADTGAMEEIGTSIPITQPAFGSEEERLHGEAKRFARLLVSEIKLYNEQRVMEGRHNRDLYVRLKRDIDRSREMYEKRISPLVSQKIDYFHDEVIRILGENDPSTLGIDYPGPRVES